MSFSSLSSQNFAESLGGSLFFNNLSASISKASAMKPKALTAQPKPTMPKSRFNMIGKIIPPVADPHKINPIARLLRLGSKHVETTDTVGTNMHPLARPMHTPCANRNCQCSWHTLIVKMPTSQSAIPALRTTLKCPTSDADPDHSGMSIKKRIINEPIQDMFDGDETPVEE